MKAPCPLPLSEAWSPVGYQVVQISEESRPAAPKPAQVPAPPQPRSPLGYQIVKVAEESPPVELPIHLRTPRLRRRLTEQPKSGSNMAPFVAIGGACFLGFLIIASVVVSRTTAPHMQGQMADGRWRAEAVIPAAFKDDLGGPPPFEPRQAALPLPAPKEKKENAAACPVEPADGDCVKCAPGGGAPGRETFGTSVQFVRNPQEAFRLARDERKLACLLHVAGNFEDSRFT